MNRIAHNQSFFAHCRNSALAFGLVFLLSACNDGNGDTATNGTIQKSIAQDTNHSVDSNAFYKRYSGTIAGQPVVVQLNRYGNDVKGAYYYSKSGRIIDLFKEGVYGDSIRLFESSSTEGGGRQQVTTWVIKASGNTISGQLINDDRKKSYPIELKEDFPAGSTRMDIVYLKDSAKFVDTQSNYTAFVTYQLLVPATSLNAGDKKFLESTLMTDAGCKTTAPQKCLRDMANEYFRTYRAQLKETPPIDHIYTYEQDINKWVLYNDNGWLIVDAFDYEYTGGAHGMHGSSFLNIDMQQHRVWQLGDVLKVDSTQLIGLLTESANAYFGVKKGEKLKSYLLDLEAPTISRNFYIGPTGLAFSYAPYEIASYAQGQVILFIPYSKLKGMFTPAFASRMQGKV